MPLRTIARMTAFSPGQSPPPVRTPIRKVGGRYPRRPGRGSYNRAALRRLAVLLLGALLAGGCGGGGDDRSQVPDGRALTIYTSLPRHGESASAAHAVLEGQRLALSDRRGRAAGRP